MDVMLSDKDLLILKVNKQNLLTAVGEDIRITSGKNSLPTSA